MSPSLWMTVGAAGGAGIGLVLGLLAHRWSRQRGAPPGHRVPVVVGVALLVSAEAVLLVAAKGLTVDAAALFVALSVVTTAGATDLRCGKIPNELVLAGTGAALLVLVVLAWDGGQAGRWAVLRQLGAGLACLGGLVVIRVGTERMTGRPGFGGGDVKLAGLLGLLLGGNAVWALYLAVVTGAVVGGLALATGRKTRTDRFAFAPCMAVGVVLGEFVVPWSLVLHGLTAASALLIAPLHFPA